VWSIWPNQVRVSVGSQEDMAAFRAALVKVMAMPEEKMSSLVHPYPHLVQEYSC